MPYRANRNEDGTWNIHDVPIMGRLRKEERDLPHDIGRKWMAEAMETHALRESQGYKYRLHIHHHRSGRDPQPAGFYRLTGIETIELGRGKTPALFADLVQIPDHVFQMMLRGDLPYRSVEFFVEEGKAAEIESLSLLTTEAPQFKFETTDGDTILIDEDVSVENAVDPISVSMNASSHRALVLFSDRQRPEENLTIKTMTFSIESDANGASHIVGSSPDGASFSAAKSGDPRQGEFCLSTPEGLFAPDFSKLIALKSDDDEDRDKDEVAKLKAEIAKLKAALAKANKASKGQGDDDEDDEEEDDDKDAKAKKASSDGTLVEMQAQLDTLHAKSEARDAADAKRERKTEVQASADTAIETLRIARVNVTPKMRENLKLYAAAGPDLLTKYVDTLKLHAGDPPLVPGGGAAGKTGNTTEDSEVSKLMMDNPEQTDKILSLSRDYDAYAERFGHDTSRAQYVASNLVGGR